MAVKTSNPTFKEYLTNDLKLSTAQQGLLYDYIKALGYHLSDQLKEEDSELILKFIKTGLTRRLKSIYSDREKMGGKRGLERTGYWDSDMENVKMVAQLLGIDTKELRRSIESSQAQDDAIRPYERTLNIPQIPQSSPIAGVHLAFDRLGSQQSDDSNWGKVNGIEMQSGVYQRDSTLFGHEAYVLQRFYDEGFINNDGTPNFTALGDINNQAKVAQLEKEIESVINGKLAERELASNLRRILISSPPKKVARKAYLTGYKKELNAVVNSISPKLAYDFYHKYDGDIAKMKADLDSYKGLIQTAAEEAFVGTKVKARDINGNEIKYTDEDGNEQTLLVADQLRKFDLFSSELDTIKDQMFTDVSAALTSDDPNDVLENALIGVERTKQIAALSQKSKKYIPGVSWGARVNINTDASHPETLFTASATDGSISGTSITSYRPYSAVPTSSIDATSKEIKESIYKKAGEIEAKTSEKDRELLDRYSKDVTQRAIKNISKVGPSPTKILNYLLVEDLKNRLSFLPFFRKSKTEEYLKLLKALSSGRGVEALAKKKAQDFLISKFISSIGWRPHRFFFSALDQWLDKLGSKHGAFRSLRRDKRRKSNIVGTTLDLALDLTIRGAFRAAGQILNRFKILDRLTAGNVWDRAQIFEPASRMGKFAAGITKIRDLMSFSKDVFGMSLKGLGNGVGLGGVTFALSGGAFFPAIMMGTFGYVTQGTYRVLTNSYSIKRLLSEYGIAGDNLDTSILIDKLARLQSLGGVIKGGNYTFATSGREILVYDLNGKLAMSPISLHGFSGGVFKFLSKFGNTKDKLLLLKSTRGLSWGGLLGFAIGGPIGAIIGALTGFGGDALFTKLGFLLRDGMFGLSDSWVGSVTKVLAQSHIKASSLFGGGTFALAMALGLPIPLAGLVGIGGFLVGNRLATFLELSGVGANWTKLFRFAIANNPVGDLFNIVYGLKSVQDLFNNFAAHGFGALLMGGTWMNIIGVTALLASFASLGLLAASVVSGVAGLLGVTIAVSAVPVILISLGVGALVIAGDFIMQHFLHISLWEWLKGWWVSTPLGHSIGNFFQSFFGGAVIGLSVFLSLIMAFIEYMKNGDMAKLGGQLVISVLTLLLFGEIVVGGGVIPSANVSNAPANAGSVTVVASSSTLPICTTPKPSAPNSCIAPSEIATGGGTGDVSCDGPAYQRAIDTYNSHPNYALAGTLADAVRVWGISPNTPQISKSDACADQNDSTCSFNNWCAQFVMKMGFNRTIGGYYPPSVDPYNGSAVNGQTVLSAFGGGQYTYYDFSPQNFSKLKAGSLLIWGPSNEIHTGVLTDIEKTADNKLAISSVDGDWEDSLMYNKGIIVDPTTGDGSKGKALYGFYAYSNGNYQVVNGQCVNK